METDRPTRLYAPEYADILAVMRTALEGPSSSTVVIPKTSRVRAADAKAVAHRFGVSSNVTFEKAV